MTAEIAILNREAVALAADSAATMSSGNGTKILTSANKVFALSKHHPIGIMIFGNAIFMGIPWETMIKEFRSKLSKKSYKTVQEYGTAFINFLKSSVNLFPANEQDDYVKYSIQMYFIAIRGQIQEHIEKELERNGKILDKDISTASTKIISEHLKMWANGYSNIPQPTRFRNRIKSRYTKSIRDIQKEVFENLPLSSSSKINLIEIVSYLFLSFPPEIRRGGTSGIVISGFGSDELFPSIVYYSIEGMALNTLKYRQDGVENIDFDKSALVMPFAQKEMVVSFIEGASEVFTDLYNQILFETVENYPQLIIEKVAPDLTKRQKATILKKIRDIGRDSLRQGIAEIEDIKRIHYVNPILQVVTHLSKNELAEMAESLVNLTCLRKKISMEEETVGGLIDVAVISKGDGLIWIKRKHYFKPELNQHFFTEYLNR